MCGCSVQLQVQLGHRNHRGDPLPRSLPPGCTRDGHRSTLLTALDGVWMVCTAGQGASQHGKCIVVYLGAPNAYAPIRNPWQPPGWSVHSTDGAPTQRETRREKMNRREPV